jgi:hypothetical protein
MRVPEPSDRPANEAGGRAARYQKGAGKGGHHDAQSANERLTKLGLGLIAQNRDGPAHPKADHVLGAGQETRAEQVNELEKDTLVHAPLASPWRAASGRRVPSGIAAPCNRPAPTDNAKVARMPGRRCHPRYELRSAVSGPVSHGAWCRSVTSTAVCRLCTFLAACIFMQRAAHLLVERTAFSS